MEIKLLDFFSFKTESLIELAKNIIATIIIIVSGIILSRAAQGLIKKASSGRLHIDDTAGSILRLIVRYGILIICVIMILNIFGINTASLIAILGAAGVAVGLALKDTMSNIAAGIILLFLGSYRKGEVIEFGSITGTVKEISLFTTIMETPDGLYVSAPNSSIWGSPIKNFSRNGRRRMELSVGIAHTDSIDAAFQVMRNIIGEEQRFLKEPSPQVILQSIEESRVMVTIRAWAPISVYWDIYWEQMRNIKLKIEEAGLHIPFPQRDIHIINSAK